MNQTQSIIVYRNPYEQAFWESGIAGDVALVVLIMIAAITVSGVLNTIASNVLNRCIPKKYTSEGNRKRYRIQKIIDTASFLFAGIQMVVYFYIVFIK